MIVITNPYPIIYTERLHLRGLIESDKEAIFTLRSDERVNAYLNRPAARSIEDAANFIKSINEFTESGGGLYWGITLSANGQLIGTICLYNFDKEKDIAEIGYELMPQFQGKGLMQEAVAAVINYSFETMKVKVLTASPQADNQSSIKLLERNNFVIDKEHANESDADTHLTYILKNG